MGYLHCMQLLQYRLLVDPINKKVIVIVMYLSGAPSASLMMSLICLDLPFDVLRHQLCS